MKLYGGLNCVIRLLTAILLLSISAELKGQGYFPATDGSEWETVDMEWCDESVDTLLSYLEARNTKSFIILVDGRIAMEEYFNEHNPDALWYWASAGKTLTATLVGAALEDEALELTDPVNQYLGEGWTSCSIEEESQRTIWHQLTMSSSFSNNPFLWDCIEPDCFQCTGAEPGTEWHYHNGVYRLLIEVVEAAIGVNRNLYTNEKIEEIIGMNGFWTDNLYWSTARDMARFGLLALNDFNWDGNPVLTNSEYIDALTSPSQEMNLAYGYLWWLNGQESFMVPLDSNVYDGWLVPSAPEDMYAALGANDQKIYVVPSQNMVVIRQGNEAYEAAPALSGFDGELWELISNLDCEPLNAHSMNEAPEKLIYYPNPSTGMISTDISGVTSLAIYSASGKLLKTFKNPDKSISLDLTPGFYLLQIQKEAEEHFQRLLIRRD